MKNHAWLRVRRALTMAMKMRKTLLSSQAVSSETLDHFDRTAPNSAQSRNARKKPALEGKRKRPGRSAIPTSATATDGAPMGRRNVVLAKM